MYHVELYRDIQVTKKNSLSGNVTVTAFIASTRCSLVHFTILTGEVIYTMEHKQSHSLAAASRLDILQIVFFKTFFE